MSASSADRREGKEGRARWGVEQQVIIVDGTVVWPAALVMLAGAVAGGVFGARVARRLPPKLFRWLVIGVGSLLTVWYFVRP